MKRLREHGKPFSEAEVIAYQNNRPEEDKESVKYLKLWDVIWFFCKNDNPNEPKDSYNRRTGIVYPGIDNKTNVVKLISTTGSFDGEPWKKAVLNPIECGFLSNRVWINFQDLENHYKKGTPFYGINRNLAIKKLGELDIDNQNVIAGYCRNMSRGKKKENN